MYVAVRGRGLSPQRAHRQRGGGPEEETAFLPVGSQLIKMEAKWKQGRVYGAEEASPCFLVQGAVQ